MCTWVLRMSSQEMATLKKPAKAGESRNQAVLSIFVGCGLVPLLFAWGILVTVRLLITSTENVFVEPKCKGITKHQAWHNWFKNLHSSTSFEILHPKTLLHQKRSCISLIQSAEARHALSTKLLKESQLALSFLLFHLAYCFWVVKQWDQQLTYNLQFFCCCKELMCQTFPKAGQQNCSDVFLLNKRSIRNHGMCQRWQLLQFAKHAWNQPAGCNHYRQMLRWWLFCCLSTNGNFPFLENQGIHFSPEMSTEPLYFSQSPPPTLWGLLCFVVVPVSLVTLSSY